MQIKQLQALKIGGSNKVIWEFLHILDIWRGRKLHLKIEQRSSEITKYYSL